MTDHEADYGHPVPDPPLRPIARGALIAAAIVLFGGWPLLSGCSAWVLDGADTAPPGTFATPGTEATDVASLAEKSGLVNPSESRDPEASTPPSSVETDLGAAMSWLLGPSAIPAAPRAGLTTGAVGALERAYRSLGLTPPPRSRCWSDPLVPSRFGLVPWADGCYRGGWPALKQVVETNAGCHASSLFRIAASAFNESNLLSPLVMPDGRVDSRWLTADNLCPLLRQYSQESYTCPASAESTGLSCEWMEAACSRNGLWATRCPGLCTEYRDLCTTAPPPVEPEITLSGPVSTMAGTPVSYTAAAENCTPSPRGWSWWVDRQPYGVASTGRLEIVWETEGPHLVEASNGECGDVRGELSVRVETECDLSQITQRQDALADLVTSEAQHAREALAGLRLICPEPICNPAPCRLDCDCPAPCPDVDCGDGGPEPPADPPTDPPPPPPSGETLDTVHHYPGYRQWILPPGQYRTTIKAESGPDAPHWQDNAQIVVLVVRAEHRWELQYRVAKDHWVWITNHQARELPEVHAVETVTGVLIDAPDGLIVEVGIPPEVEAKIGPKWAHWGPGEGWRAALHFSPASSARSFSLWTGRDEEPMTLPEKLEPVRWGEGVGP